MSILIPRLVVFGVCVIAFFIGLWFNKRDDARELEQWTNGRVGRSTGMSKKKSA
jgi:hypothetical protein